MSQPRDDRQDDLFRTSLEAIINLRHPLVRLAAEINWDFLAKRFSSVCRLGPGQPPLPTRLVAGLEGSVRRCFTGEGSCPLANRSNDHFRPWALSHALMVRASCLHNHHSGGRIVGPISAGPGSPGAGG